MKKLRPELCPDEPLSQLIESAKNEPPKDAIRCLKHARCAIKRVIREIKKHLKRFPMSRRHSETLKQTPSRPVQVVNARLGVLETGNLPSGGFHFCPPDPSVVQRLLLPDAPETADAAAEPAEDVPPSPAPDAMADGDVLILASRDSSSLIPRS